MTIAGDRADRAHPTTLAGVWKVDPEQSHASFVAATLRGAIKIPGAFGSLSGHLVVGTEGAGGTLTIDPSSVYTGNRVRDRHLRGKSFFGVARHPQLSYELRSLAGGPDQLVRLDGDLVVAGRRTTLPLEATLRLRDDGDAEIACHTLVDRVELGVRGARLLVPREVELDVAIVLRPEDRDDSRPGPNRKDR
jgi:polyisoprenoid-binding protein YceI